jgi:acid phosphatase
VPAPAAGPASGAHVQGVTAGGLPRPRHVVVVVEENRAYRQVLGSSSAPYLNALARRGALLTRSFAITHPSEPNYLALFSGSTHGLTSDSCPHTFTGPNLAGQLRSAGRSFTGYAEGLPRAGYLGCSDADYARKHVPWTNFPALPADVSQPFTAFPHDYARLPSLAFVIPDLEHDMHNGSVAQGDRWLRQRLGGYVNWAGHHDSLLVVTWDEDDGTTRNQIPTILVGQQVRPGHYAEHTTHYRMLRTLEALERVPAIGAAARTRPLTGLWRG